MHRIIKEFRGAELIIVVGKDGKAPVYGLNPRSRAAVETARSLMDHARRIAAIKAGLTEHGGVTLAGEPTMVTVELTTKRDAGQRKKPRVSVDLEA